jgi:hypothetical protein
MVRRDLLLKLHILKHLITPLLVTPHHKSLRGFKTHGINKSQKSREFFRSLLGPVEIQDSQIS